MRIFHRQLIYIQVHQDHFIARLVGGDRTIRRQCHALGNRAGPIKDFSNIRPLLKATFSELMPGFSLVKPWGILHFDPVEYLITREELAGFQKAAMQSGVSFCFLSTWEQRHEDEDLLGMLKRVRPDTLPRPTPFRS
ncbi:hypothetical protein [Stenotrophomonas maltophilia]|uniref:Uncharacterized protein n=1 Tax=Stenotrophomonas maltophilia TaxID=40324 RepID=A0A2W6JMU9_STEMA|nr:hypothetical protein [Stenotrophomonas maltophilia]PZS97125.1 hypothetical protein A7X83_21100 [Stenotrophomonas maltophilia]